MKTLLALVAALGALTTVPYAHAFPTPDGEVRPVITATLVEHEPAVLAQETKLRFAFTLPPIPQGLYNAYLYIAVEATPGVSGCDLSASPEANIILWGDYAMQRQPDPRWDLIPWVPQQIGPHTICVTFAEKGYSIKIGPRVHDYLDVEYPFAEFNQRVLSTSEPVVIDVAPSPLGSTMEQVKRRQREIRIEQQTGRRFCTIPAVRGLRAAAAAARLRAAGCKVRPTLRRYSPSVPRGRVISVSPKAGERTSIPPRLTVSRGPRR